MIKTFHCVVSAVAFSLGLAGTAAGAQDYPNQPLRVLVGFSAGGPTDIVARVMAQGMSEELGVPLVVENKPGAGGNIGATEAKLAKPDGYTLFFAGSNHTINAGMYEHLPYDPVQDFEAVSIVAEAPSVMVARPDFPADDAKGLMQLLKDKPDSFAIATAGGGQLQAHQFMSATSTSMIDVPYKGAAPAIIDLAGGHVDLSLATLGSVLPQIKAGQVKAIAAAAPERSALLPDVPTFEEQGYPGIYMGSWYGLLVPKGTPKASIDKLAAAVRKVAGSDGFREKLAAAGLAPVTSIDAERFAQIIQDETGLYRKIGQVLRSAASK
ncbi:tripartite tricarboxylate transporter substrate binding protein [Pusillimonas sp. SM2304]|uniref:Bug family tripartite tricarboxylate transporter substrate binding protein n=1 Tax=Pusillimonas sp. SM2304 TaxID=3073241 RepID=UPI0028757969|nr:tripartite tricarboxylate transporter substrate binding protein [Pusillimonas sp. SM2304]MDS1142465.1 tripartite tricarboxylate transporter substrate binding protein [Pusillimonas sp. SM2304]